jgi:hypothetical protein
MSSCNCEQSNLHQCYASSSGSLPHKPRTFGLSEIPKEITVEILSESLNNVRVGQDHKQGNSCVQSLAPYRAWQVATVSFHYEPREFQQCRREEITYLTVKARGDGRAVPINIAIDCDRYG